MNVTNDFVSTLINSRERIVDKLEQNYSYDHLHNILCEINSEKDPVIKLTPDDKFLYRVLSGDYQASRYLNSSIDWLPTEELVDSIINLANVFGIASMEEICTGLGLLSALIKRKCNIPITAADTFENSSTCNKLNLLSIARRGIDDYRWYRQLNEPYPEMVIVTRYPTNYYGGDYSIDAENKFVSDVMEMINSNNHKIIILIVPNYVASFYRYFYHLQMSQRFTIQSYYIKAFDKNFYISNLLKDKYKSSIMAHIIVNRSLCDSNISIEKEFEPAIIPSIAINHYPGVTGIIHSLYHYVSPKLIKYLCNNLDFYAPDLIYHQRLNRLIRLCSKYNKIHIPQQIYDMDEMMVWLDMVDKAAYLVFNNREEFYQFYIGVVGIRSGEDVGITFPVPQMVELGKYIYVYLLATKQDLSINNFIDNTNKTNRRAILGE